MAQLELIVLGTGPAAGVAAKCARAGWQVGIVDPRPFGGTCALRGCNPKKVLVRAAEAADLARRMNGHGLTADNLSLNWAELIRFKREFTQPIPAATENSYQEAGIQQFHGAPKFTGANTLEVDGEQVEFRHALVATGAVPMNLTFSGAEHLTSSDDFLELDELPEHILFVGGGYISFEFAHVAARAGAKVTICEMSERPLAGFDADLVNLLVERSRELGITVRTETQVEGIESSNSGSFAVQVSRGGGSQTLEAGLVVHGAGRVPNVHGLDLEAAGIDFDKHGIQVNDYLQSVSNVSVFAAGDVAATGMPALTPVANEDARAVAHNLLKNDKIRPEYGLVPSAVFTAPALASVGLNEQQAAEKNIPIDVKSGNWAEFSSMRKVRESHAAYKIILERKSERILGAHLLGPESGELINLFAIAIKSGLTRKEVKSTLFVFPTLSADIRAML